MEFMQQKKGQTNFVSAHFMAGPPGLISFYAPPCQFQLVAP